MFIPGFLLLGVGIGILFEQMEAGALIGVGLGFLIQGMVKRKKF